jgi:hypothetical protein
MGLSVRRAFAKKVGLVVLCWAVLAAGMVLGQVVDEERGLLQAGKMTVKELDKVREFRDGKASIRGAYAREGENNETFLDRAAMYYAYRLTEPVYQKGAEFSSNTLVQQAFDSLAPQYPNKYDLKRPLTADQLLYMKKFGERLTVHLKKVMKNDKKIARVNAARILARLGECGQPDVADALIEVLDDPEQNDAVKFYALSGMKGLFEFTQTANIPLEPGRVARCVEALLRFIKRKPALPAEASKREWDAVIYVRREAVRALALSRYPAVVDEKTKQEVLTALELVYITKKEGLTPEPTLAERVEAAVGLCQMQPALFKAYQPVVAAHHLGWFVVAFLKEKGEGRVETWKVHAARLIQGLERLKVDTQGELGVATIVERAKELLRPIETGDATPPDPSRLIAALASHRPQNNSLYKNIEKTDVPFLGSEGN